MTASERIREARERKPLYQMTDEELSQVIESGDFRARQTATTILVNRQQQRTNPAAFTFPQSR